MFDRLSHSRICDVALAPPPGADRNDLLKRLRPWFTGRSLRPQALEFRLEIRSPDCLARRVVELLPHRTISRSTRLKPCALVSRVNGTEVHDLVVDAWDGTPDAFGHDGYR